MPDPARALFLTFDTMPRSQSLDLLRAIAIVWVMLFHAYVLGLGSPCESVARWGWMGVDLFFVLSGYLIGRQVLQSYRATGRV
jgi:peptidoglycan/LPS O-acetylase OafA/YrhL